MVHRKAKVEEVITHLSVVQYESIPRAKARASSFFRHESIL